MESISYDQSLQQEPSVNDIVYAAIPFSKEEFSKICYHPSMKATFYERGLLFANDVLACEQSKRMLGVNDLIKSVVMVLRQNQDIPHTPEYVDLDHLLQSFGAFDHMVDGGNGDGN